MERAHFLRLINPSALSIRSSPTPKTLVQKNGLSVTFGCEIFCNRATKDARRVC
jgi:hypothetical protein